MYQKKEHTLERLLIAYKSYNYGIQCRQELKMYILFHCFIRSQKEEGIHLFVLLLLSDMNMQLKYNIEHLWFSVYLCADFCHINSTFTNYNRIVLIACPCNLIIFTILSIILENQNILSVILYIQKSTCLPWNLHILIQ